EQADDYEKAVENYRKAIQGDDKYAAAYYGLGRAQFILGKFDDALKSFTNAVGLQDQLKNEEGKATALNGLGAVYYQMGRDAEAIQYSQQSAEIKKRLGDLKGYANSLNTMAQAYRRSGKFVSAILTVQESISNDRAIGDLKGECGHLESLGSIYLDAGRLGDSLRTHQESLRIAREISDERMIAANLGNIGTVYSAQGRYADAEVYYQQALEKRRATGDKDAILRSLVDLGNLQTVEGADEKALESYLEGMKIAREIDDLDGLVALSLNLAELYIDQGHYRAAGASLDEALKLIGTSADQVNLVLADKFSADLAGRLGRQEEAESKIADAGAIADTLKNESLMSDVLTVKGRLRLRQSRLPDAASEFRRALDLAKRGQDSVLSLQARIGLGLVQALAGEEAGVRELQQSAKDADSLGNATLIMHSQVALARAAFHANRLREADAAASKALARGPAYAGSELFFQAHLIRGLCSLSTGQADQAGAQLGEALRVLEKLSGELPDASAVQKFFSRPDLKIDLIALSKGLDQSGRKADAAKVAGWAR
ncbi:MAG: tetratricopeptide repeat protein, partial [Acidobacteria bacterium]|nr:tetratricopeptide repeat protein [Acidobacteriota bacterium]